MACSRKSIDDFLARKRIAVVGVSRNPTDFGAVLFREFLRRGYDAVPVNPNGAQIDGQTSFARVQDIRPPVEAALLLTRPQVTETVVRDCAEAGIRHVWMYRAVGKGAVSRAAVAFCERHGIDVVPGHCPFMFFPGTEKFHRFHGWLLKITGRYPA